MHEIWLASFPVPAQLSVACSMEKRDFSFVCGESLGMRLRYGYLLFTYDSQCSHGSFHISVIL